MKFDDIRVEKEGDSNGSPLEITLFEGIVPTCAASSVPYAWGGNKKSDNPGMILVGYVIKKTDSELHMTSDKLYDSKSTRLGGWGLGRDAIHSIRKLQYKA